jgi:hypothetical protein
MSMMRKSKGFRTAPALMTGLHELETFCGANCHPQVVIDTGISGLASCDRWFRMQQVLAIYSPTNVDDPTSVDYLENTGKRNEKYLRRRRKHGSWTTIVKTLKIVRISETTERNLRGSLSPPSRLSWSCSP